VLSESGHRQRQFPVFAHGDQSVVARMIVRVGNQRVEDHAPEEFPLFGIEDRARAGPDLLRKILDRQIAAQPCGAQITAEPLERTFDRIEWCGAECVPGYLPSALKKGSTVEARFYEQSAPSGDCLGRHVNPRARTRF
jgi:hypothetical protein